MNEKAKGGAVLAIGGMLLCLGYALDPACSAVTLEKVACVGTMGTGTCMIAFGALSIYWGARDEWN